METQTINEIREGIRLRNTQKGYTWDITIEGLDVEKLQQIDQQLKEKWGNKEVLEDDIN